MRADMSHHDERRADERIAPGMLPKEGRSAKAPLTGFQRLALLLAAFACVLLIGVSVSFLNDADAAGASASRTAAQGEQAASDQDESGSVRDAKEAKKDASSDQEAGGDSASGENASAASRPSPSAGSAGGSSSGKDSSGGSSSASAPSSSGGQQGSQFQGSQGQGSQSSQQVVPRMVTVHVSVSSASVGNPVSASATLTFAEGATVYDALCGTGLSINAASTAYGVYVAGINGLAEKEHGAMSGWTYYVNGVYASRSCSSYVLSDGDSISWVYIAG